MTSARSGPSPDVALPCRGAGAVVGHDDGDDEPEVGGAARQHEEVEEFVRPDPPQPEARL